VRVLITGANGQLGRALKQVYPDAVAVDRDKLDITDPEAVAGFDWTSVAAIINAAAYTNVDGAQTPEGGLAAQQINADAVTNLAKAATVRDIPLIHISTDYVFDGTHKGPIPEDLPFSPLSVYGRTKAAGDVAAAKAPKHYIVRTSWVIGEGKNFVKTMLGLGGKGVSPAVVADQVGRPTFTGDLAAGIKHLLDSSAPYGTYNLTNEGEPVSWADLARESFKLADYDELTVTNTTTTEYFAGRAGIAPRPLNSVLDLAKIEATGFKPLDWHEALADYVAKEQS